MDAKRSSHEIWLCNVKKAMAEQGMNITQLAERCGMSRSNLSLTLSGRYVPSFEKADLISGSLGFSLRELLDENFRLSELTAA